MRLGYILCLHRPISFSSSIFVTFGIKNVLDSILKIFGFVEILDIVTDWQTQDRFLPAKGGMTSKCWCLRCFWQKLTAWCLACACTCVAFITCQPFNLSAGLQKFVEWSQTLFCCCLKKQCQCSFVIYLDSLSEKKFEIEKRWFSKLERLDYQRNCQSWQKLVVSSIIFPHK